MAFTDKDAGGSGSNVTVIGGALVEIVIEAESDFVSSAAEVAVTVTLLPEGTADGAV